MKKYYLLALTILALVVACNKAEFDKEVRGEALGSFRVNLPAANATYLLNPATPEEEIEFSWTAAKPGVSTTPTYAVVFYDDATSVENPIASVPADNNGAATKKVFTHQSLNELLASKGVAAGQEKKLYWVVKASNGSTDVFTEAATIFISRSNSGASNFILLSPAPSADLVSLNPNSETDLLTFKWTKSEPTAGSPAVKYTVVLTPAAEGATPFRILSDNDGADTTLNISHAALATMFNDAGFTDQAEILQFNWNVEAQTGDFSLLSKFQNAISINREVNMYLVGSINGWNINEGIKMISDKRNLGKVFYSYIKVGEDETVEFKFFAKLGDWGSGYGNTGVAAPNGGVETGYNVGQPNIVISTPGIYRLTIDLENDIYYVQERQVGIVGDVPGNGGDASNPIFGKFIGNNSFEILVNGTAGNNFKLHEGDNWDSGLPYQTRYYGTGNATGLLVEPGGDIPLVNTGVNKVVFDGSNPHQLRYSVTAYQMKMRGGEEFGGWDWNNAISMSYQGNGLWQGQVTLASATQFKFCATEDWSINYGKASTAGLAEFNGSINFDIGAGTWFITFNEYTLEYTISPE